MVVRVGIVGAGFGAYLARTLAAIADVEIAGIADRGNRPGLGALARSVGTISYSSAEDLIKAERPDAVVIALPPHRRDKVITAALSDGLAIFIEKPMSGSLQQAEKITDLLARSEAPVMMGFSFRHHAPVVALRSLLDGELGRPLLASGAYVFDWRPPDRSWVWKEEQGGGFFNENSCHLFDVVCHLMGEPKAVFAAGGRHLEAPSTAAASVVIDFGDGRTAALALGGIGTAAISGFPHLELFAEGGQARLGGLDHMWTNLDWALRGRSFQSQITTVPERIETTRYTPALTQFINCVKTGAKPVTGPADGLRAVRIADAVYRSLAKGKPINL